MPPPLAALLTAAFIIFLLVRDFRRESGASAALWLPVLWLGITGSRFVSHWLSIWGFAAGGEEFTEGSPIDALYFSALILAGVVVLARRPVVMSEIVRHNRLLLVFVVYSFLAVFWSDFPFVAFKRWIKTLGHPVMALLILTDPNPAAALRTVMKRLAYFLLPTSLLFIKYFPQYGRGFSFFTGQAFNSGVTLNKNDLGYVCMVSGIFFFWNLLTAQRTGSRAARQGELVLSAGFLFLVAWLLKLADSATSLAGLVLGAATMILVGLRSVNRRLVGTYVIVAAVVALGAEWAFGLYGTLIETLGRDPTLTDRTEVWADALRLQDNPLLGAGFESFWLGSRLEALWKKWWWTPIQAHNGYIETYLNLGAVGVLLLFGVIVSTFRKIGRQLITDFDFARLRLALLMAILAFNFTEAAFKGVHLIWTMFYIIAIDYYPRKQAAAGDATATPQQTSRTEQPGSRRQDKVSG